MEDRLLSILRGFPDRSYGLSELMAHAKLPPKREKEVKKVLKGLVREGILEREPGRRYRLSRAGSVAEGRVIIDRRGLPSFLPKNERKATASVPFLEDGHLPTNPDDDNYRVAASSSTASPSPQTLLRVEALLQDDEVRVELTSRGRRPRTFAKLLALIHRPERRRVGIFRCIAGASIVDLDENSSQAAAHSRPIREVIIPPSATMAAEDGQLVEVTFAPNDPSQRSSPIGEVVAILGRPGERGTELRKLMIEHNLDRDFPPAVLEQAEQYGDTPTEADYAGRRDVRHLPLVTIDGETAKDFDDAVCAIRDGHNTYKVYVAIADVSHYVRRGTPLDEEAYARGTSTYLTDRAIPMLPEKLSNGLCSLNPHVDRLCMIAELSVAANGRVTRAEFSRGIMRSQARLTYTQVAQALEGETDEHTQAVLANLLLLSRVATKMLERRLRRGSLDLDLPEPVVEFDATGEPSTAVRRPRNDAHRLIEDLMIATNEAAARFFLERELDTLFRVHAPPDPDKMQSFTKLCFEIGIEAQASERPSPAEVSQLLIKLSEHERGSALHSLLLRALSAARYHAENEGHFGLASEAYLHFTSPIRRYPDLVVHRLLKQAIDRKAPLYSRTHLQKMGDDSSAAERRAMTAERASMDLDRAYIANKRTGEQMKGNISGIQTFGLFVSTLDPFLEGMIPVQTLPDDFYEADPHNATLIGTRRGHRFGLGDPVEVIIHSVNLTRRQVELRLVRDDQRSSSPGTKTGTEAPLDQPRSNRLDPRQLARKLGLIRKKNRSSSGGRPRGRGRRRSQR
ncbi:MAG: ribonuclease R [Myxococcales bacterium]|nr:ribonuclease R [Myxococcales bacterium]